ncbi:MAG TPA: AraC family transcriptional regulator [Xanthobacteraceae bacterium]|nr:AraC family transcriptional regulator [Xanthobacteraceae bacterium]
MLETPIHADPLAAALARKALNGASGSISDSAIASGEGWRVQDIICTCGPRDHEAEELTSTSSLALILAGSFVVRDQHGTSLLSEGSYLLINAGHCFACSHRHGEGDRCLSFRFEPEVFERIAHHAGAKAAFAHNRLPPLRDLSGITARARQGIGHPEIMEEVAFELAGSALGLAGSVRRGPSPAQHHGRLTRVLRYMATHSAAPHKLTGLASMAAMSPYHFLRTFRAVTGVTPHQWLLRARLREAAERLANTNTPVTNVALDVGFDDLSNFTRSFRAEFGAAPREYRLAA